MAARHSVGVFDMKILSFAAITALAVGLAASSAAAAICDGPIEAISRAQRALTSATDGATPGAIKRSYDRALAAGRREAIAAWSAKVRQRCPNSSSLWLRATNKSANACDRAMGGKFQVCARGTPRPKLFNHG
jgi:hypothetical protein